MISAPDPDSAEFRPAGDWVAICHPIWATHPRIFEFLSISPQDLGEKIWESRITPQNEVQRSIDQLFQLLISLQKKPISE